MVKLVTDMTFLHDKKVKEKNPESIRNLDSRIQITDNQIDRLTYDLYGLKEDEIELIESSN